MHRAFKYRLYPNRTQRRNLEGALETHRRLYNAALAERIAAYEAEKRTVKYAEQSARFTVDRKTNLFYARITAGSGHTTLRRLDKAYRAFFRRLKAGQKGGFPRFKRRDEFDTIEYPNYPSGAKLDGERGRLYVQFVADEKRIRVKVHRPHSGKVKTLSLKREGDN